MLPSILHKKDPWTGHSPLCKQQKQRWFLFRHSFHKWVATLPRQFGLRDGPPILSDVALTHDSAACRKTHTQVTSLYKSWGRQWNLGSPNSIDGRWCSSLMNLTQPRSASVHATVQGPKSKSALPAIFSTAHNGYATAQSIPTKVAIQNAACKWYVQFKMIQNDHVGISFSDSLSIRASKCQRTSINHGYPGGRNQATSDVSYGCSTGVSRSYAPHESCSFNLRHQPSCKIGIPLVIVC